MPEYYLTATKKEELEKELNEIKSVKRPAILKRLIAARELGDLKENAEYHVARDEQGRNESRIREIEELLKFVVVVEKNDDGVIGLGSVVIVKKIIDGTTKEFTIVGPAESDITSGKIGSTSPLGEALIDKKVGDIGIVVTPKGGIEYEIIDVQ